MCGHGDNESMNKIVFFFIVEVEGQAKRSYLKKLKRHTFFLSVVS